MPILRLILFNTLYRKAKKGAANFFGVGESSGTDDLVWQARRMRMAAKNFGELRLDRLQKPSDASTSAGAAQPPPPYADVEAEIEAMPSSTTAAAPGTSTDAPRAHLAESGGARSVPRGHVPFVGLSLHHPVSTQKKSSVALLPFRALKGKVPYCNLCSLELPFKILVWQRF